MHYALVVGIDCSAASASCCLLLGDKILAQSFVNAGLTHSRTLLPLIKSTLRSADKKLADVDCIAVSAGPGSFTGVRIGIATVKGLCFTCDIPCVPVSTLEAIPQGLAGFSGYACAVMDARCNQVYTATFELDSGELGRLTEDRAVSIDDLAAELEPLDGPVWLCGDGGELVYNRMLEIYHDKPNDFTGKIRLAPEPVRYQTGYGVALAARKYIQTGAIPADELVPTYLRPPQAERELGRRKNY